MKKGILLLICFFTFYLCRADSWTRKADFPGGARDMPSGFSIGNYGYIGGGGAVNEFWKYDPSTDTWTQMADPPFTMPDGEWGVTIDSYAYLFIDSANEFWQYAPLTDSWTRKADVPGAIRYTPMSFTVGGKVYLGGGTDSNFYCYDPATNTWRSIATAPFLFDGGNTFTSDNRGYITGLLTFSTSGIGPQVMSYDPATDTWTQKANFPSYPRTDASALSIGGIGYFGVGDPGSGGIYKDWWQYNAYTDSWVQKTSIPCADGKDENIAFTINNTGYICFGDDLHQNAEVWEYKPDSVQTTGAQQIITQPLTINLFPDPATTILTITAAQPITSVTITNPVGKAVYHSQLTAGSRKEVVDVSLLAPGIYFVSVSGSDPSIGASITKFVKE